MESGLEIRAGRQFLKVRILEAHFVFLKKNNKQDFSWWHAWSEWTDQTAQPLAVPSLGLQQRGRGSGTAGRGWGGCGE